MLKNSIFTLLTLWLFGPISAQQTDYDAIIQPVDAKARDIGEYMVQLAWLNSPEGRIAEARSQLRQEALRMRAVLNQVKMEVHDALAAVTAAKEQVAIAQAGLQMATKELDLARERYAVITASSYFELTNGLTSVARGRENLVNALFQLNASRVNLARSTGSLDTLQ